VLHAQKCGQAISQQAVVLLLLVAVLNSDVTVGGFAGLQ
jgi:hypothetical protein